MLHHVVVGDGKPLLILHGSTVDHRHMMETFEPVFNNVEGWRRILGVVLPSEQLNLGVSDRRGFP